MGPTRGCWSGSGRCWGRLRATRRPDAAVGNDEHRARRPRPGSCKCRGSWGNCVSGRAADVVTLGETARRDSPVAHGLGPTSEVRPSWCAAAGPHGRRGAWPPGLATVGSGGRRGVRTQRDLRGAAAVACGRLGARPPGLSRWATRTSWRVASGARGYRAGRMPWRVAFGARGRRGGASEACGL